MGTPTRITTGRSTSTATRSTGTPSSVPSPATGTSAGGGQTTTPTTTSSRTLHNPGLASPTASGTRTCDPPLASSAFDAFAVEIANYLCTSIYFVKLTQTRKYIHHNAQE